VRFDFKWLPAAATLLGLMLFVYLGLWQSGKGDRLEAELAQHAARHKLGPFRVGSGLVDAEQLRDAPITVSGQFDAQQQFFLDNRQENGLPGVHVITPLKIDGSDTRILVNRGWVGWANGRGVLPNVTVPSGQVTVTGLAFVPSTKKFFLMPDHPEASAQLWSRLDLVRFATHSKHAVQPVVLLQNSGDANDTLIRRWDPPENRVGMHRGYAFQWFGMALALIIFFLVASSKKGKAP